MRERTTWNRSAAQTKVADPYLMNQDHVSQQPKADEYVIGDPSTFAEDVHPSKDTWEAEYSGGQVKRNEIGMAEMRADTFKHPEKTAADQALLLKKADLCIKTAGLMLRTANETAIEDQAVALMHLPNADLITTYTRLANQDPVAMQQQADMAQQAAMQHQAMKAQWASMVQKANECMAQGDLKGAKECMAQADACMAQMTEPMAAKIAQQDDQDDQGEKAQQAKEQGEKAQQAKQAQEQAQEQDKPAEEPAKEQGQAKQAQQVQAEQIQAAVQQAVAQVMQALQNQQAPVAQQQAPQAPVAQDDSAMLADMLMMEPAEAGLSEMGIEMEPSPMDVGEMDLGPEDDVLMTLFAADQGQDEKKEQEPAKDQAQQGQAKQAMARTASTRTVGTRPTQGVSRVGGGPVANGGNDVNKLAALWPSAPDVSDAFR